MLINATQIPTQMLDACRNSLHCNVVIWEGRASDAFNPLNRRKLFNHLPEAVSYTHLDVYKRQEEVFIVREGMTLERNYRVKAITPSTLTLIYLPLKQSQTISIGGSPS